MSPSWVNLPVDILTQICEKLDDISDRIRFSAVCQEWFDIHCRCSESIPPQPPMLLLSTYVHKHQHLVKNDVIYSSKVRGPCNIRLPLKHSLNYTDNGYISSSNGWLINIFDDNVELLNPFLFSNNVIQLPKMPKGIQVSEALLSHNPTKTSNYLVFVIYNFVNDDDRACSRFAYVKSGVGSWNTVCVDMDIAKTIYYKGKLYALLCQDQGLICCDITTEEATVTNVGSWPTVCLPENWDDEKDKLCMDLVESRGDLLCVTYIYKNGDDVYSTVGFQIFIYEIKDKVWKECRRLQGGQAIFLNNRCGGCSMSVDASKFQNCMPNHIYFLPPSWVEDIKVGVFNLDNASIQFVDLKRKQGTAIWVQPTLNDDTTDLLISKEKRTRLDRTSTPYLCDYPRENLLYTLKIIGGYITLICAGLNHWQWHLVSDFYFAFLCAIFLLVTY